MFNETDYRPTRAIIKTEAIRKNAERIMSYLPQTTQLIAVVKSDGYGHGAVRSALTALEAGATMLAVATLDEAATIRKYIQNIDILVLGPSPSSFAAVAAELDITLTVTSTNWVQRVNEQPLFDKKCKIHVKIDSGMGRIGVRTEQELAQLLMYIQQSDHLVIDGAFTHFSRADEQDAEPTKKQFQHFTKLIKLFPVKPRLVHASNSAAALMFPEYSLDAIRYGISLYGISPSDIVTENIPFPLHRAMTIETELSYVKKMPSGQPISYGGRYTTSEEEWIGTLPIGYADGLKRGLTGQDVLIGGKRAPIVGTICMDQCMITLPHAFPEGEKVVVIGKQGDEEIRIEEWANRLDTIPYEIVVTFSPRIPRIYK
ncbi:alanine racemase [Sporosarcina sp. PTS2304]|uniref:alanine racemase n=1 Tax=Sporosarcina sp. PTS2304 TaxID=2283194 RepID=UPI000E0DEE26|nr:alanine racemase [Sporosarcina sp. PTS2304]AXI00284.1 alanine racemase [Sporosarcina sp. PTS2304]